MHVTWNLPCRVVAHFEYSEYAKFVERVGGARQNVSFQALSSLILEDHTNKLYDLLVFLMLFFYF